MTAASPKQRAGESGGATGTRPAQVLVQHRGGNRQVEVSGQRWHVPRGRSVDDIPASDPVGDRLQAAVDDIARGYYFQAAPAYVQMELPAHTFDARFHLLL